MLATLQLHIPDRTRFALHHRLGTCNPIWWMYLRNPCQLGFDLRHSQQFFLHIQMLPVHKCQHWRVWSHVLSFQLWISWKQGRTFLHQKFRRCPLLQWWDKKASSHHPSSNWFSIPLEGDLIDLQGLYEGLLWLKDQPRHWDPSDLHIWLVKVSQWAFFWMFHNVPWL